jgi:hypothetical protein
MKLVRSRPEIVLRKEEKGAFLFDSRSAKIKTLNNTGCFIWNLCDGSMSAEDIARRVAGEFPDAPGKRVSEEVGAFLEALKRRDLITEEQQ